MFFLLNFTDNSSSLFFFALLHFYYIFITFSLHFFTIYTNDYREPSLVTGAANYSWVFQASNNQYDASSTYYSSICEFSSTKELGEYMNEQYTEMVESVKKYGGFYIGRYETSLDTTKKVVQSKIDSTPMSASTNEGNTWYRLYYKQDSIRNSSNPYYSSTAVVSSMICGSQYDQMLNRILEGNEAYMVFERTGNHSGGRKVSGAYGSDVANNIIDLSSNLREWTQEICSTYTRVYRGGNFHVSDTHVTSTRSSYNPTYTYSGFGSRLTLYIRSSGS